MPENSLPATATGYERRLLEYAAEHFLVLGRSKARRLAIKLCKRQARMMDLDLERIFAHADPTPQQAFRNIEASLNAVQACR
ncbi:hypothetical protein [Psychromicrobium lacuslunae]|uniref:Uncharacterized protein n=1 Tax=Psychromicrobium lacuslunae TaxID=1618207 RepID=A0A0D4C124_9MICC|nr:hypothetical protein [Psychromicrobium lacuslunae]AJT42392.1 hypothetical protein UM93_14425 [Psychromicrobium lacuslunae]